MSYTTDTASISRNIANSSFKSGIVDCLTAKGWSSVDLSAIDSYLDNIIDLSDLDKLKEITSVYESKLHDEVAAIEQGRKDAKESLALADSNGNKIQDVQDNKYSKKKAEPAPVISKVSNVASFPAASNALSEDYPNSYGEIDDSHNWYKVNKTAKSVEFVHNSGSSLKIDRYGNASIHITGSLKWIVDSDMLINVLGSMDMGVLGDMYQKIASLQVESDGAIDTSSAGSTTFKTPSFTTNTPSNTTTGNLSVKGGTTVAGSLSAAGGISGKSGLSFERHVHPFTDSRGDSGTTGVGQ